MANVSALIGGGAKAPTTSVQSLIYSSSGTAPAPMQFGPYSQGSKVLSGALTANTYKELLSVSAGGGTLYFAGVMAVDTTARTVGLKIVVDGNTVCDQTCAVTGAADQGFAVGAAYNASTVPSPTPVAIPFRGSLSLQVKSSLSETDKVYLRFMVSY